MQGLFKKTESLIVKDINTKLAMFNDGLLLAGVCVLIKLYTKGENEKVWFEVECTESKIHLRMTLKKFCTTHSDEERNKYLLKKRGKSTSTKKSLCKKKGDHTNFLVKCLKENISDSKRFWETVKTVRRKSFTV